MARLRGEAGGVETLVVIGLLVVLAVAILVPLASLVTRRSGQAVTDVLERPPEIAGSGLAGLAGGDVPPAGGNQESPAEQGPVEVTVTPAPAPGIASPALGVGSPLAAAVGLVVAALILPLVIERVVKSARREPELVVDAGAEAGSPSDGLADGSGDP